MGYRHMMVMHTLALFPLLVLHKAPVYPPPPHPSGQNGRYFAVDIFRCTFVNEHFCILIKISLKFVPGVQLTITQHYLR